MNISLQECLSTVITMNYYLGKLVKLASCFFFYSMLPLPIYNCLLVKMVKRKTSDLSSVFFNCWIQFKRCCQNQGWFYSQHDKKKLDLKAIRDPSTRLEAFFLNCFVCVCPQASVWLCLLNTKGSQYVLYYKWTCKTQLSPSITAGLRQRLLFELLCLSNDTSFILLRSMSAPFVIVHLKGISLPL